MASVAGASGLAAAWQRPRSHPSSVARPVHRNPLDAGPRSSRRSVSRRNDHLHPRQPHPLGALRGLGRHQRAACPASADVGGAGAQGRLRVPGGAPDAPARSPAGANRGRGGAVDLGRTRHAARILRAVLVSGAGRRRIVRPGHVVDGDCLERATRRGAERRRRRARRGDISDLAVAGRAATAGTGDAHGGGPRRVGRRTLERRRRNRV